MVLAPVAFDSKQQHKRSRLAAAKSSSTPHSTFDLGGRKAAAKHAIIPDHPTTLRVKSRASGLPPATYDDGSVEKEESMAMHHFVRKHVKSLFEKWEPTWWLDSGHLQTVWSSVGKFNDVDIIEYERTTLELPDGGLIAVDFTSPAKESVSFETPIVIVLPGLTGGSQASYVRTLLAEVSKPRSAGGLGLRSVVVNSRGCGDMPLRTPRISAGSPDDLRSALLFIRQKYPNAPLYGVGFSLGATVLTKYLGQEGAASELRAGCVLACPWDLQRNSDELEKDFIGRNVYSKALAKSYLALLHRSLPGLTIDQSHVFHSHLEIIRNLRSPTFTKVNTHLTAIIGGSAPDFPHASVHDFYRWASCERDIAGIRVPLLAINADDDPIVQILPEDEIRSQRNEDGTGHVMMVVTRGGGHLGWFHGVDAKRRWISTPIVQWLRALDEEVIFRPDDSIAQRVRVLGEDGFTRAEGEREDIGFRVFVDSSAASSPIGTPASTGDTSVPGAFAGL